MTEARYHELLGQMLDSRLSEADAAELRQGLDAEPARLRDLREHLMLWELWTQEHSPGHSGEAFCRAFEDRLHAELHGSPALRNPHVPAAPRPAPAGAVWSRIPWLIIGAVAACLLAALTAVVSQKVLPFRPAPVNGHPQGAPAVVRDDAQGPPVRQVSVRGEAVCTRCILHMTADCQVAIRVHEHGREEVLLVGRNHTEGGPKLACCMAPVPVLAQGTVRVENGRQRLAATRLEILHPDPRGDVPIPHSL